MIDFTLAEESLGYVTLDDPSNTDKRLLVAGSQNVLIDTQKRVRSRPGYTRLGIANTNLEPILNAWTWNTSTGIDITQRNYNGIIEAYLGTVDGYAINAWTKISGATSFSTTAKVRPALSQVLQGGGIFDPSEKIDLQIMVNHDSNLYEWGGGIAVVASSSSGSSTVTKKGTSTFAENRFYTARNEAFICVRTGTEYAYTGGTGTTTLTGVTTSGTFDLVAGDILVQKIVTTAQNSLTSGWGSSFVADIIFPWLNAICVGSKSSSLVFVSKNSSGSTLNYTSFAQSAPRVSGEGGLLTLDGVCRGINSLGTSLLAFSGLSTIFKADLQQITVSTTLAEVFNVQKLDVGLKMGALNHESIVSTGNQLAYLTNEVALRTITNKNLIGLDPKRLSTPIKPDFDAETWDEDNTFGVFYKNTLIFNAGATAHAYMLNFVENAQGKVTSFWNPPQLLPAAAMSIIDIGDGNGPFLYGHSNSVPESYKLFDGLSDGQYDNMNIADKIAIHAIAKFAYNTYGKRELLKVFDEYAIDGAVNPNTTDLLLTLFYDFDGYTQTVQRTIDGSDEDILQGLLENNSIATAALAKEPLGGLLTPPADARRFHVIFEEPKEDFFELSAQFETNDVDRYWAILAHGANAQLSPRRPTNIKK